ncbi:hypothetical protein EKN06_08230 [Croceicoccus ponticola]|uniref:DUF4440 domain-containing protein n=1 Tax=Croceicoccus ponticola TaxID=2217664 RepID=A0A437GX36_9SPHN|nr:hypothetical protein [Croceicoccus ponticola]RVQ66929.1 hypothetical protein EKN06_08230 [Croceicoccus ponticola]
MTMYRLGIAFACAALLAGCAASPRGPQTGMRSEMLKPIAKPGDVVATELAFARAAGEKGRWAAFREYAADTGVMFVPEMVNAQSWLKRRAEPTTPLVWEPYEVWSSCDGSIGVTRGGWRSDTKKGWFTTVWQRQDDGSYRWLLDHGDEDAKTPPPPEMIEAHVAECPKLPWPPAQTLNVAAPGNGEFFGGASDDGTLRWGGRVDNWGGRIVTIDVFNGTEFQRVLHQTIAPPVKD